MSVPMLSIGPTGAVKDMYGVFRQFMGIPTEDAARIATELREFGRLPADEAWVFRCMSLRADAVAGVPLRVQVHTDGTWQDVAETDDADGAELQFLLDDVNPAWEGATLQAFTEAGDAIHGGSYWRKVRGRLGGHPQELHWLAGPDIEPLMGPSLPTGYRYRPPGAATATDYDARDIIAHRAVVNLQDPYKLLSPLSAIRYEVATNRAAAIWNQALLANWGIPPGAWVADKDVELNPQEQGAIRRALRALRGPRNQGKVPVLPGGLKWQPLSLGEKDADWIASRKVSRMTVCGALGVPLVLAGDDEKSGVYAQSRDAERILWRLTLIPSMDRRASRLDSWLVPDFDRTRRRLRVRYDYSGIEALRAPAAEDMQQMMGAVDRGWPINRWLARYGVAPIEGGDESVPRQPIPNRDGSQPTARPEEYASSIRALGKRLYRHPAVRAYLQSGEPAILEALVPEAAVETLAIGLQRRYSAEQIVDGVATEGFAGIH